MSAREVLRTEGYLWVGGSRQVDSMEEVECHLTPERQYRSRHIRSKKKQSRQKRREEWGEDVKQKVIGFGWTRREGVGVRVKRWVGARLW